MLTAKNKQEFRQGSAKYQVIVLNMRQSIVLNVLIISGGVFFMNKATLIAKMAEKSELSKKQAEAALNAFTDTITEALKAGEKVQLMGFGTFSSFLHPTECWLRDRCWLPTIQC